MMRLFCKDGQMVINLPGTFSVDKKHKQEQLSCAWVIGCRMLSMLLTETVEFDCQDEDPSHRSMVNRNDDGNVSAGHGP